VLGVEIDGHAKAYPFSELDGLQEGSAPQLTVGGVKILKDSINDQEFTIRYDTEHRTAMLKNSAEEVIPTVIVYWFAWVAFNPTTDVFIAKP
jgi:hypothetical protein